MSMTNDEINPIEPTQNEPPVRDGWARVPLTTEIGGVPHVVVDDNGEPVLTEIPYDKADTYDLVPLMAVVDGVPEFVWDENNELAFSEVPRQPER